MDKVSKKFSKKACKTNCSFLKPGKIMKDGKMTDVKCCMAYTPYFEVPEERTVCEQCKVPEMTVSEQRCKYLAPFSIKEGEETVWTCLAFNHKNLDLQRCCEGGCESWEKADGTKWEKCKAAKTAKADTAAEAKPCPSQAKRKFVPKTSKNSK